MSITPARPRPVDDPIPAAVWKIAGVVVFGAVMGMLDTSLVNIGLKTIATDLGTDVDSIQWVASAYLIALAVSLPLCGWLTRRLGAGRLWLGALVAFTVTSCLCALAGNVEWLIAMRVLQGLSAGLLLPAGQAILGRAAGPQRMGRVMGVTGIAVVGAPTIGPTVGGLMLDQVSWQWLFLINLPLGLAAFVLGLRTLPLESGTHQGTIDVVGLLCATIGVSAVVYGLGELGTTGTVTAMSVWLPALVGPCALAVFVRRTRTDPRPLLDLHTFENRTFAAATMASFFTGAAMFGAMFLLPLYFQLVHDDGLVRTGLLLAAYGAGGIIALPYGGRLTDRLGGGVVATLGSVAGVLFVAPFAFLGADANAVLIEVLLFGFGVATALSGIPLISTAYAAVRSDQVADAAALINILQRIGGAVGVAGLAVTLSRAAASDWRLISGFQLAFGVIAATSLLAAAAAAVLRKHQQAPAPAMPR